MVVRRVVAGWALACALGSFGCTSQAEDPCGLKTSRPDTPSGTLQATRDGANYVANSGLRGYRLNAGRTDVVAGDVTLNLGKDKDGRAVDEAVNAGDFPICILLKGSDGDFTYAFANSPSSSYQTDGSHTGSVLLIAKDGDELIGRFAFEAVQNGGSATTKFEDGSFRLGPR